MMHTSSCKTIAFFLHGLDSSSLGFKARWFKKRFPDMRIHDYRGDLACRLAQLEEETKGLDSCILVGSSYGGLMAACHAKRYPERCTALILLAPALNYENYEPSPKKPAMPVTLLIGKDDTVCPPDLVLPLAEQSFSRLDLRLVPDDHLLHHSFQELDWANLLRRQP